MTIDTSEFDRTLVKYMKHSKRTIAQVVNQKAYWITAHAMKFTKQADKKAIRKWARNWKESAPVIIKSYNLKKPFDKQEYIKKFIKYRLRGVGYLRAGFVMALRMFGRITRNPKRVAGMPKLAGRPKGSARFANDKNWSPKATIINATGFSSSQSEALQRYGTPALSLAFASEIGEMKQYLERKMKETGRRSGVRHK